MVNARRRALLVLFVLFAELVFAHSVFADDVIDVVNVTVPVSCSMSEAVSGNTEHTATIRNNEYESDIGLTNIKVFCNDKDGYSVYAIGYSEDTYGNTEMVYQGNATPAPSNIVTGTATSGNTSNWAMKLSAVEGTYAPTILNGFGSYRTVPSTYTQVATFAAQTDNTIGSTIQSTYAIFVSPTQQAGTYQGKVRYTLVHPDDEGTPPQPQPSTAGYINYYANASNAEGTMGRQSAADGNIVRLLVSNFSREGYGFAGWSDAFDYATNPNANFYGPNEDIMVPIGTTDSGLALYAVWVKSAGTMQANAASVCSGLTAAVYSDENDSDESTWSITASLNSVSALTDARDGQTYAIAKLADGRCWMIENLRLADAHTEGANTIPTTLTTANTNNPLNDGDSTNPIVALKHNYTDTQTFTNLSPTSSVAYDESTAPDGWCTADSAACFDQSRLRTDNTANRATYATASTNMTNYSVNLYLYGNYYNWYSATAGNGTYNESNVNTEGDICPAGWHLPTGTGTGEYGFLSSSLGGYKDASNVAQNMSNSTTPTGEIASKRFRRFPNNFIFSGNVNSSSLNDRGSSGYYWSSTAGSNNTAYYMVFTSSNVYPGKSYNSKYNGRVVRCIVTSS